MDNKPHPIIEMLKIAVPLYIAEFKACGGPTSEDMQEASALSQVLGERGDILLFGGGKKAKKGQISECADMFNKTAKAIAMLSFVPGGIEIFGLRFGDD